MGCCYVPIFGWSDLLPILRAPAGFSFAVSCIIVFKSFIAFLGGFEGVDDVISQIKVVCEGISCFYITGHGIDESLMKNVMKRAREFFNLPMDKKVCISLKKSTAYRGYIQQGVESIPACMWCDYLRERARWPYLGRSGVRSRWQLFYSIFYVYLVWSVP